MPESDILNQLREAGLPWEDLKCEAGYCVLPNSAFHSFGFPQAPPDSKDAKLSLEFKRGKFVGLIHVIPSESLATTNAITSELRAIFAVTYDGPEMKIGSFGRKMTSALTPGLSIAEFTAWANGKTQTALIRGAIGPTPIVMVTIFKD